MHYMQDQDISANNLYWKDQEGFWTRFVKFSECLVDLLPVTALHKCRSLIEDSSKSCLEKLEERHKFKLSDECSLRLTQLRERLALSENEMKEKQAQKKQPTSEGDLEPPEGFRELDSGHVQYRLLREDCFGPLREGLRQYIADPQKWKYDHIRVYNNVRFLGPYIPKSQNSVGSMVQMDITSKKWPKRINWAHSKRFLFGSLLLFTRDKCNSLIVATLLDRNVQELKNGKFAVSIMNTTADEDIYNDVPFVMIESEVYFEPYFQVLNALKAPDFPAHIPMEEYIIKVNPEPAPPAYLNPEKEYTVTTEDSDFTFKVLDDESWPNKDDLGFDESQYEAYKLALTKELAVIQGPPGTGKTYLGVKVAQALLNNLNFEIKGCLMMVICYTNHALDQFLEALLPITQSIARIGGRSRNENMDKFNINNLRQLANKTDVHHFMMRTKRRNLRQAVHKLQNTLNCLDTINNGVLSHKTIESFIPEEIAYLGKYWEGKGFDDPLQYWLFEHSQTYMKLQEKPWLRFQQDVKKGTIVEEDDYKREEPILDEFEDEDEEIVSFDHHNIKASFTISGAEALINHHLGTYRQSNNYRVKRTLEEAVRKLHSEIQLFNEMSALRRRVFPWEVTRWTNFYTMKTIDRWSLYFRWANKIADIVKQKLPALQNAVKEASDAGAARLRKLLQALGPPIVIVEEAAEVLEAHIVTSLTKNCKHLILIGDHQQLRPSISNMKLVRRYNTNVSLFERMIENGVLSHRLGVQHRMRPEFAALISPHIYSDLYNHPSVQDFPNVIGMTANLFFFNHDFQEQKVDDSASRTNHQEADLTLAVANYLMQQGYHPTDVTILTTYAGQMFYMRKQRENYLLLSQVKITVVDNYQGEESKIILLSLVRNNLENNVGFLKIENRICVALSRAKEGLYIFGNINTLKTNSDLWMKIAQTLESNGRLGTTLTLKCENHPEKITTVSSADDLRKLPEGGCGLDCATERLCGHKCPRPCHVSDREHTKIKCLEKCKHVLCDLGHICPLKCWQRCEPCKVTVEKDLPCGHKKRLPCHVEPADSQVRCDVETEVILPACGHKAKKSCSDILEKVLCPERCKVRVEPCGHSCGRKCHVNDDPDHEKYVCRKPCARAKDQCRARLDTDRGDHQCKRKCFESCEPCTVQVEKTRSTCRHLQRVQCSQDIDKLPCQEPCEQILSCEHKCPKKCGEECGGCVVKVMKTIPDCNHKIKVSCWKEATRENCQKKCERVLSCGHVCMARCSKVCDPESCVETVQGKYTAPCGHQVSLPCNVYNSMTKGGAWKPELLLKYCTEPCLQPLACDHLCSGSCGTCFQGRLHAPCSQTCNQLNICGHMCLEPCNQVCPPCNQPCVIKCSCGVRCNRLCGAPCSACKEPCTRKCRHGACTRRCGEPCSRAPCDEACARRLPCGHRCRGLCGEPCPDICNVCRPDDFPRDFLGDEYDKKDKFIKLQDCPHVFEVDDMDAWITNKPDQVKIPDCPKCRKAVINTYRYKDAINRIFKMEINPIKERVFGNSNKICARERELSMKIGRYREVHRSILLEIWDWKHAFDALNVTLRKQKKVSLLKVEMQHQYLNILDMIGQCYKK
ncbi:AAA domain-containing protein [Phthorimaea operculella]|nr:AAA domain-containing protein [Phthorimaea operculella]